MSARGELLAASLLLTGCSGLPSIDAAEIARLGEVANLLQPTRALDTVDVLVAEHDDDTPLPCDSGDPRFCNLTHSRVRAFLRTQLTALSYAVSEQRTEDGDWTTVNVVAERRGTTRPEEIILVTAHYDAFWAAADDNSTGVAAALELARTFATSSFERTVRFVFFDLEELGLIGSTRYVRDAARGDNIVAFINLDAVGYADETPGSQSSPIGFPKVEAADFLLVSVNEGGTPLLNQLIAINAQLQLVKVLALGVPSSGGYPLTGDLLRSDHAPLWQAGKSGLFFTDTANFRNPHYHSYDDTSSTLSPDFYAGVVRLAGVMVAHWAGGTL